MTRNFPEMDLWKGWRLEPCDSLPDVAQFESITVFPARVLFWAPQEETFCKHRNPLLDPAIGVTVDIFAIDNLAYV